MLDAGDAERRMADYAIDGGMAEELVADVLPWVRALAARAPVRLYLTAGSNEPALSAWRARAALGEQRDVTPARSGEDERG